MMTIREYWELQFSSVSDEEYDDVCDREDEVYRLSQEDEEGFAEWAVEHDVDLDAVDDLTGEYFVTLWVWDMCGD